MTDTYNEDAWWMTDDLELVPDLDPMPEPVYVGVPFRRSAAPPFRPDSAFRWGAGYRSCGLPAESPPLAVGLCLGCVRCADLAAHFGPDFGGSVVASV